MVRLKELFIKHKDALLSVAAVALLYLVLFLLGITCPIKFATGVSCPGCGMTRAWLSVFRLDFAAAFDFHPIFWIVPLVALFMLLKKRIPALRGLPSKIALIAVVLLFVAVYLFRMFDPDCTVVVFQPTNSIFYRIIQRIFNR